MSFFENRHSELSNQSQTVMSPAEAFAAITLISISIDGYISNEEVSSLLSSLNRMHIFRSYPSDVLRRLFDRLLSMSQKIGTSQLLQIAVASLPHELHETAFATATDLILADGEVTPDEDTLLTALYKALNISEAVANKIIDVMLIKNKG